MTVLLIDALIALTKLVDRGLTAVEQNVRLRATPPGPVVGAQSAGAARGCAASDAGPGGHPIEPTSELLTEAAAEIQNLGQMAYSMRQPWIEGFAAELRDRAATFAAHGD